MLETMTKSFPLLMTQANALLNHLTQLASNLAIPTAQTLALCTQPEKDPTDKPIKAGYPYAARHKPHQQILSHQETRSLLCHASKSPHQSIQPACTPY